MNDELLVARVVIGESCAEMGRYERVESISDWVRRGLWEMNLHPEAPGGGDAADA